MLVPGRYQHSEAGTRPLPGRYQHFQAGIMPVPGRYQHSEAGTRPVPGRYQHHEAGTRPKPCQYQHSEAGTRTIPGPYQHSEAGTGPVSGGYQHSVPLQRRRPPSHLLQGRLKPSKRLWTYHLPSPVSLTRLRTHRSTFWPMILPSARPLVSGGDPIAQEIL